MHFFKALLFLGAGSVIHAVSDEQDMRKFGGLQKLLPFSYSVILIGSLALVGFPFLTGFYSKDVILEVAYSKHTVLGHFCYYLGSFSVFFTAFYSTRLLFLVFLAEPNGNKSNIINAHESSWRITLPLLILSFFSIFIGFLTKDLFIGFGSNFWNNSIFILPKNYMLVDIEFISLFNKQLPLILTLSGIFLAYSIYATGLQQYYKIKKLIIFKYLYNFLSRKWYFDRLYNEFVGQNILYYSYFLSYRYIDRGVIEIFGPFGIIFIVKTWSNYLKFYQTGHIFHYLFFLFISILFFLFVIFFV